MSKRLIPIGIFIGYIILTLLVYAQTLQGGFLVDDWWWAATAKAGGHPLFGDHRIFFRPLSSGIFVGFWHLFGANPLGYRLASLTFLILTAWVIRAIWLNITYNKQPWAGALAGALFILWPSHSEAVAWIAAFSDLLIVLFGAVSLWSYLLFLRKSKPVLAANTILFLVLALLTKESAVTLPVIVFALGQVLALKDSRSRFLQSFPSLPERLFRNIFKWASRPFSLPSLPVRTSLTSLTEERGLGSPTPGSRDPNRGLHADKASIEKGEDIESAPNDTIPDVDSGEVQSRLISRSAYFEFAAAIGLTLAYILIRRSFLGGQIGGYNGYKLPDVLASIKGWKMTVNLCNLYFPVAKYVAINLSPYAARVSVLSLILGTGAALVRSVPRAAAVTPNQKRFLAGLLFAGAIWAMLLVNGAVLGVVLYLVSYKPFWFASPVLLVLVAYLGYHMGTRWWRDVVPFLSERKLSFIWMPAAILLLLIELNRPVLSNLDFLIEIGSFAVFLYAVYLSRPLQTSTLTRQEDPMLRRAAYAMFFVSIIAIMPSIALPIDIDGQQGRFSYLGTFFSVIALTAAYTVLIKAFDVRRWTTATIAGILSLAAYSNASEWAQAGAISRQVTRTIKSLLPARRIYVVFAPETIYAALLFRGGIEQIPYVFGNDKKCLVAVDFKLQNMIEEDRVDCQLLAPDAAGVRLERAGDRRLEGLRVTVENKGDLFENAGEFVARFRGFQPTDHAIYIDAEGGHILE